MGLNRHIRLGMVDNVGPNNLVSYLRTAGAGAASIDVAVAFVTSAGLDLILHLLQRVAKQGSVRVITGLYHGFTEPKALRTLLCVEQETGRRLAVRLSTNGHFHWKSYFLLRHSTVTAIVGSPNLTDDGLQSSGELNAVLTLSRSSPQFTTLHGPFEKHWQSKSMPLSTEIILRYEQWRSRQSLNTRAVAVPVRQILGSARRRDRQQTTEPRFWLGSLSGELTYETVAVLQETTSWTRRGFVYMSTWKPIYSIGDRIVLFDLPHNVGVVRVIDTTQTPQMTPDGKHFAAYRYVPNIPWRRLVKKRWQSLKQDGLIRRKDDVHRGKRLSEQRFAHFVANLKAAVR